MLWGDPQGTRAIVEHGFSSELHLSVDVADVSVREIHLGVDHQNKFKFKIMVK